MGCACKMDVEDILETLINGGNVIVVNSDCTKPNKIALAMCFDDCRPSDTAIQRLKEDGYDLSWFILPDHNRDFIKRVSLILNLLTEFDALYLPVGWHRNDYCLAIRAVAALGNMKIIEENN